VRISPARRLIIVYALITASTFPLAAIEDDISTGGAQQIVFGLIIWTLILRGLWKGSELAWWVAVLLDALMIVGLILMQPPKEVWVFVMLALAFGQLMILFSPSVRAHARTRAGARLAQS
jgi:hypothetical protein